MTSSRSPLELARRCAAVLDEKKAGDIRILDVAAQSSITDMLVVATATSEPHLRALRVELEKTLDAAGDRIVRMESERESGWLVVDLFDVMVHVFLPELRARYRLEQLWKDAVDVPIQEATPAPKKPRARKAKAKPAAKRGGKAKAPSKRKPAPSRKKRSK
jgi:ribosome-associated protein